MIASLRPSPVATDLNSGSRQLRSVVSAAFLVVAIAAGFTGCAGDDGVPDDVAAILDVPGNVIADLTGSSGESYEEIDLLLAADRAQSLGVEMRYVIVGPDREPVSAQQVANRYGGLAMSFRSGDENFNVGDKNIDDAQVDRAVAVAGTQSSIGDAALAFVEVFETEGVQAKPAPVSTGRTAILVVLALAVLFFLSQLYSFLKARKRATKRRADFETRRDVLEDWAKRLIPEVNTLTEHQGALGVDGLRRLHESREFVAGAGSTITAAESLADLDVAEIRIARTAMKLRDLRREIGQ